MPGTYVGTPTPIARTVPVSAKVINHKSIVPKPGWFTGNRKTFEDW